MVSFKRSRMATDMKQPRHSIELRALRHLSLVAALANEQVLRLPLGSEKDSALKRARQVDLVTDIVRDWITSRDRAVS
jgi:hypothetical protein